MSQRFMQAVITASLAVIAVGLLLLGIAHFRDSENGRWVMVHPAYMPPQLLDTHTGQLCGPDLFDKGIEYRCVIVPSAKDWPLDSLATLEGRRAQTSLDAMQHDTITGSSR
jgi:hypothetical protein